ncbi:uncharacterized protein LOC129963066 [Argiope bruennichi]|uniref:uncharacterized protein LOC129963066 n=1 Tax=Argiope bruennichi TaxID=94029 RepID=UPI002495317E|nr:uncharacterized protein LOC129963066 [Argiope bruennichi]
MAACTDTEEKPSSPKENSPVEIHAKNAVNHEMRKNCYNELCNTSKNSDSVSEKTEKSKPDVNTLSEDEFLQLMIEASTFNKSSKQESALLKQLRSDNPITDTEPTDKAALFKNSSQFSVHRNSKHTIGTNSSSFNSSSCYLRTSDNRKKHSRNKDDSSSKSALNLNVLQKGIHQSQSLQDLMSSDLSKSKKSHKAHRTHSLSSDEVTGIETDSLIIPKSGKKSYKQSSTGTNSSKSEVNKSKSLSKATRNSDIDSVHLANKIQSNGPKACSNYQSLSDSDIPTGNNSNSQKVQSTENTIVVNSPVEIEMEEIKSDKKSSKEEESLCGKELEKSMNGPVESNSKFYIDCHDIDSTVSFPLKLVSGIDDQNNRAMSEGMKFPNVPWPRPIQVQSFFSSLPMDTDSFGSRSEKQILNADINGNPFGRASRSSNIASFVSSQLSEYGNGNLASETKNRKNKRLRNSVNKGVLAEHIAGHRGQEDIDDLVQYIMSDTDKKKGNSPNQIVLNKNSLLHENERKKSVSKELKNFQKNSINTAKKKLTRSNSLENMTSSTMTSDAENLFISEPEHTKDSKTNSLEEKTKNLDINSNEESKYSESVENNRRNSIDESSSQNCVGQKSPDISGFAADFYSTSNVSSQTTEDTGFSVVKKKQRKKQGKRSESYRWRNPQNQRKKGMMLTLAESKCGKQDSRRKSTSSVPHSDHSSADNSDLDSVHSLPVRGSAPHQTQPHPHTTPSSSSSTPQASYADIARMPISKLNSTSPNIAYSFVKPHVTGEEVKRTDGNGVPSVKRKVSDSREPSVAVKGIVRSPASEKESDISNSSDVKIRSQAKSTREINTQTEPESIIPDVSKVENLNTKTKKVDESPKTLCSSCSRKGSCSCSKSPPGSQKLKNNNIPPVIMDNMPPESNVCNVSFGFGVEEVLQMTPGKKANSPCLDKGQKNKDIEGSGKSEGISEISSVNSKSLSSEVNSCSKSSLSSDVSKTVHSQDLKHEQSSHLKTIYIRGGKNLHYAETEFNDKKFNRTEIATYFGNEFHSVKREFESTTNSSKMKFYEDSSEEA